MKKCSRCKVVKSKSKFWKDRSRKDGLRHCCIACLRKDKQEKYEHYRNAWRKSTYGVDDDWYNTKLEKQKGVCAICGKKETMKNSYGVRNLCIDHNHFTGQIRGLLCSNCNRAIGSIKEDIPALKKAIEYLECYNRLAQEV